jgi:hypothetical protein
LEDLARRYYKPLLSFFRKRTHNAPGQLRQCRAQFAQARVFAQERVVPDEVPTLDRQKVVLERADDRRVC